MGEKMPLPSNIDRLPAEAREALDGWLRDPAITQIEAAKRVNALLEKSGQGELRVSRDAVGRYHRQMRKGAERLRQSRVISEVLSDKFGSTPAGQVGHLIIHMLRALTFDLTSRLQDRELDDEPLPTVIKAAGKVTRMVQRLERSSEIAARRERDIKRQADEERKAKSAGETKERPKLDSKLYRWIVREVYGLTLDDKLIPSPLPANHESRNTNQGLYPPVEP